MSVETLEVHNITFHVYYDCKIEKDPYGTGDSPTEYQVNIMTVEIGEDTQNVYEILPNVIIEKITEQLIQIEAN
jgi:hypothetical protein